MKIVFTQKEMKEIITKFLKDHYSGILGEDQIVTEVVNVGNSFSDVELIIEEIEENK